jgi:ADP-ribosyl-[dinitrogen reductase] hydrolase
MGFRPPDQIRWYCQYADQGHLSSTGIRFNIGTTVVQSLRRYQGDGNPYASSSDPLLAGNGCIMRLAPISRYYYPNLEAEDRFMMGRSRSRTFARDREQPFEA